MTEKRFKIDLDEEAITDNGEFCLSLYCFQDKGEKVVCGLLNELAEENEQLKSVVKEVIELLSEEVDVFSDKATEHDINAYIELKELDKKDAYYMATATKKAIKLLRGIVDD